MNSSIHLAWRDLVGSYGKREYIWMVTVHNLKQTYTKTRLGLLWIPLNKIIFGLALGSLYGTLFKQDLREYLPYVMSGIIIWQFIAASISTGMRSFSAYGSILHYFGSPKFIFPLQVQFQQFLEFLMLIPVVIGVCLLVSTPTISEFFLFLLGFLILLLNLFWVGGVLSVLSLFFRDIEQLVDTSIRLLFLVTPIIWKVESLSGRAVVLEWNPFYHLVQLIRAPLLGESIDLNVYLIMASSGFIGLVVFFLYFASQRKKIVYMI